jgi:hypothetical protein
VSAFLISVRDRCCFFFDVRVQYSTVQYSTVPDSPVLYGTSLCCVAGCVIVSVHTVLLFWRSFGACTSSIDFVHTQQAGGIKKSLTGPFDAVVEFVHQSIVQYSTAL